VRGRSQGRRSQPQVLWDTAAQPTRHAPAVPPPTFGYFWAPVSLEPDFSRMMKQVTGPLCGPGVIRNFRMSPRGGRGGMALSPPSPARTHAEWEVGACRQWRARVRARMCTRMRACVRACVRVCVCVWVGADACACHPHKQARALLVQKVL